MPARFVFELEPVLELRRRAEEDQMRAVAALERDRLVAEQSVRGYQAAIDSARADLKGRLSPVGHSATRLVTLEGVRLQANASLHMVVLAQRAAIELTGVLRRLEAARGELLRRTAARKAVELLRQRRWEAWRAAENRRDQAETDELAVMRARRPGAATDPMRGELA